MPASKIHNLKEKWASHFWKAMTSPKTWMRIRVGRREWFNTDPSEDVFGSFSHPILQGKGWLRCDQLHGQELTHVPRSRVDQECAGNHWEHEEGLTWGAESFWRRLCTQDQQTNQCLKKQGKAVRDSTCSKPLEVSPRQHRRGDRITITHLWKNHRGLGCSSVGHHHVWKVLS